MAHRFGGDWTSAKLGALQDYLGAYTTALKHQGFTLYYLDAFAGSGTYVPAQGGHEQAGSALIALEAPFATYFFVEKSKRRCRELQALAAARPDRRIIVAKGDANEELRSFIAGVPWRGSRAVLFLDPYGMQVEWETLQAIATTEAIDVWYLFPLSAMTRQMARSETRLDEDKRRSLDRLVGTSDWRNAFYETNPQADIFGAAANVERHADSDTIQRWVTERLQSLFPVVVGPQVLRRGRAGNVNGGPRLFALYFLASTKAPKAQGLCRKLAKGVIDKLQRETGAR